jgi:hypothetical protein
VRKIYDDGDKPVKDALVLEKNIGRCAMRYIERIGSLLEIEVDNATVRRGLQIVNDLNNWFGFKNRICRSRMHTLRENVKKIYAYCSYHGFPKEEIEMRLGDAAICYVISLKSF